MLTQNDLMEQLEYLSDGRFIRKVANCNSVSVGDIAGSPNGKGYIAIRVNGKKYKAHRLAWLYVYGEFPCGDVDHINHDKTDNKIENLRIVTNSENHRNRKKKNGMPHGVSFRADTGKWRVRVVGEYGRVTIGSFIDVNAAIMTRYLAQRSFGYHENHGRY